ncbi:MAG: hypothetical protein K2G69_09210, partial [Muribaculaceae bacterium]|nr:hypothetical protein [Muribaculaceae bacterium]
MAYRKAYLLNHDIDWYGRVSGRWIVASTMGGQLPSRADDERFLPLMQVICSNLPYLVSSEEITVNEDLIQERYERAVRVYREYYINNDDILRDFLERYTLPI